MRILMVASWFPYPPDNGSRIRAHNLITTLASQHEVSLLSFVDEDFVPAHADALQKICRQVVTTPRIPFRPARGRALAAFLSPQPRFVVDTHSKAMQQLVDERLASGTMDFFVASELSAATYVRDHSPIPALFDDLELGIFYHAYADARGIQRWRNKLTWFKLTRYVRALAKRFRVMTVVSEREREIARKAGVDARQLALLPNAIDAAQYEGIHVEREPNTLIYTGALTYGANLDAMRYFVQDILPLVRAAVPQARLTITGRADQVAINELSVDNAVLFTGYIPDVRPKIAASQVCIVPLRVGGGTRLKILEAMALGTPVVATSKGVEGLDLVTGQEVLIGDTPAEFAAHVIALLRNPQTGQRLADRARARVLAHYDWRQVGLKLQELVREF